MRSADGLYCNEKKRKCLVPLKTPSNPGPVAAVKERAGKGEFYKDNPARQRATQAPTATNVPADINEWLTWIDEREEKAGYPIDHSDGGEDDDPAEHDAWAKKLESMGRNPRAPWTRQVDVLEIDPE